MHSFSEIENKVSHKRELLRGFPLVKEMLVSLHIGETLTQEECTLYRELAARAMYLSLDRPDCMFATGVL